VGEQAVGCVIFHPRLLKLCQYSGSFPFLSQNAESENPHSTLFMQTLDFSSFGQRNKLLVGSLGFEPRLPTPQAGILDQARLRPHSAVERPFEGRIVNVLLKLKTLGKSDGTLTFVSDRLKHLTKQYQVSNKQNYCIDENVFRSS
jgi:hypothetical protein